MSLLNGFILSLCKFVKPTLSLWLRLFAFITFVPFITFVSFNLHESFCEFTHGAGISCRSGSAPLSSAPQNAAASVCEANASFWTSPEVLMGRGESAAGPAHAAAVNPVKIHAREGE